MARTTRMKRPATMVPVPQSATQVTSAIAEIGDLTRRLEAMKATADEQLARIAEAVAEARQPLVDRREALQQGVQTWCEANRHQLTEGGKRKFHAFISGRVLWRLRPPSVRLRGADAVVEACRALGLQHFLRTKVEVNKDAMLADPESAQRIEGVTISSAGEEFVIEPAGLDVEAA